MTALSKKDQYKCREGTAADAVEIHNLMQKAFADYARKKNDQNNKKEVINSALREDLEDIRLDLDQNIVLVLSEGKNIIASLRLEEISEKRFLLKRFAVAPGYQNQGLGTMLFEEAVE